MSLTASRREQSLGLPGKCSQCTGTAPPRGEQEVGSGWLACLLFNSGWSLEENLGGNSLLALIPAGGLNLKLVGPYE